MRKRSKPAPPSPAGAGHDPPAETLPAEGRTIAPRSSEEIVDEEWRRIEAQRLAEEVDEARDDMAESVINPSQVTSPRGVASRWGALTAALIAGIVFALAVNLWMASRPTEPAAAGTPPGARPPSQSEQGPGIGQDAEGESAEAAGQAGAADSAAPGDDALIPAPETSRQ